MIFNFQKIFMMIRIKRFNLFESPYELLLLFNNTQTKIRYHLLICSLCCVLTTHSQIFMKSNSVPGDEYGRWITPTPDSGYAIAGTNGAVSQSVLIDSSGVGTGFVELWLRVWDMNGCENGDTVTITFVDCTGLSSWPEKLPIRVFPNPFRNFFMISCDAGSNLNIGYVLQDAQGKTVMKQEFVSAPRTISTDQLSTGIYFLVISDGAQTVRHKTISC
jgi:hypothetical protein